MTTKQHGHDLTAEEIRDVSLLVTVYPPYADLLQKTIPALEKYWPCHPSLTVGKSKAMDLPARMLEDIDTLDCEFVVVACEDFRLSAPVKQREFDLCLDAMRNNLLAISCSLTWEPSDIGIYHCPKISISECLQRIPTEWNVAINFQMRIWRRELLMKILASIPPGTSNVALEPLATKNFRKLFPNYLVLTYAFPNPPKPKTFVDNVDKSQWIIPYQNLVHAGQRRH